MKRKIIKQGNGTLTITLPKQWTKDIGLDANNEVELTLNQNNMVVHAPNSKKQKTISINVDNFERLSFAQMEVENFAIS